MRWIGRLCLTGLIGFATIAASPYADMTGRSVKALSPERIEDLLSGAGAGYALAAELNGYPGPRHVLDLADALMLTPLQRDSAQRLFAEMTQTVLPLGRDVVSGEAALDALFAGRRADEESLLRLTRRIAAAEAELRAAHLRYHIRMSALMTPHQRALYQRLRGYAATPHHEGHAH